MKWDGTKISRRNKMLLGDLIINYDNKRIPLSAKQRENIEKNYPYYGAQGIIDYVDDYLFEGKYLLIAEDGENLRSRKQPIATIVEGKFWVNNHAHIVTSNELSNLEFLCFWLNSNDISEYITGSAQPKLNQNNMNLIALPDFSREEQDRIAEKLCVYEKKIKNNLVNIALLVNVVNEIYKETFIQKSKLADGQYAESTVFENIIELKEKNKEEKDYPVLSVVKEGEFKASEDVFTKQVYSKSTKNYKIVRCNQVAYNPARANIGSIAIGTTRQNFPFEAFKMFPMVVPPMELQLKFEEIAKPIEQKIAKLKEENEVLAEIRDTLLPKLMNRELPVEVGEN